jgi:hypothetical protein
MKTTLLILCLLSATAAFAQYYPGGSALSAQPMILQLPDHPGHASYAPLAPEQSLSNGGGYTSAQGDRPASDFPQAAAQSLGEIAREFRKQHALVKKARIVWEKQ